MSGQEESGKEESRSKRQGNDDERAVGIGA